MRMSRPGALVRSVLAYLLVFVLGACQSSPAPSPSASGPTAAPTGAPVTAAPTARPSPVAGASASPTAGQPSEPPGGIYWATFDGRIADALADIPARVWVPNERDAEVVVIDPATFEIVDRLDVGAYPEHVSPSWDGQLLYVNNMKANSMSVIDPRTGRVVREVSTPSPYNLYFTPDGTRAIVVEDMTKGAPEDENGLRFYSYPEFEELGFVGVPWAGADHLDFSADGKTIFLSCEYSARVVTVDVATMRITDEIVVGGYPTDVRLSPDGRSVFVANQFRHGLTVIDADTHQITDFIMLDEGSHGLAMSRDATQLYVTNRLEGSLSVIDIVTRAVVRTTAIGGSPDMLAVSPDGSQVWISNRWHGNVSVFDSRTWERIRTIRTGAYPHGLAYWPLPGRYSLGHNGNMR